MKLRPLKSIFVAGVVAALPSMGWALAEEQRPNIVLVFIDDMGWADLSCYGNEDASTPQIDTLAAEGIAFDQFYVNAPICSPSRVAISTGTYPDRWQITSYLAFREENEARGMASWLDPKAPMLSRSLQEAGYATGHFGKWHMGGQRDVTEAPPITAYGFDESLTNFEGLGAKLLPVVTREDGTTKRIWVNAVNLGEPVTWMQRSEITNGFIDAAIVFMDKAQEEGKPFYVNIWPDDVHSPWYPPMGSWGDGDKRDRYLGVLESMDTQLGKLFDYIRDDPQLRDNTLLIVCSDNGPEKGGGLTTPFRGYKRQLYEGGIRSPLIVWAPGLLEASAQGTRNTESVFAAFDLVPSLVRLGGASAPEGADYDGEDVLDTLLGTATTSRAQPIFFSRPTDKKRFFGADGFPDLAVREGDWKLLCEYDGSSPELYDLSADPGEAHNLAQEHPALAERMSTQVVDWYRPVAASRNEP